MNYTHLTREERYQIHALRRRGLSCADIARDLQRHRSSISRELKRNAAPQGYKPAQAHDKARARQCQRRNAREFCEDQWKHVSDYLRRSLSPEQAAGRLRLEKALHISTESIYQYVYEDKRLGGDLVSHLRCQKVRRKRYASGRERRGVLKNRTCIEKRPAIVDERIRIGDWEGDTVIGKAHQGALVTLVERKSRYTLARRVRGKHASGVSEAIIELLRPHKASCHTLTFDNGKEFAEHEFIAQCLRADVYFAHPTVRGSEGSTRTPMGCCASTSPRTPTCCWSARTRSMTRVYKLNHRPRKCLGYRTPHEVFYGLELQPLKLPSDALCT